MRPLKYTRRHAASQPPTLTHTTTTTTVEELTEKENCVCATLRDPTKRFVHIVQNLPRTLSHLIVHDKLHVANCAQNLFFHLRASLFVRPVLQSCFSRITTFALCPAPCVWTARHCVSYRFSPITVQFAQSRPWELRLRHLPTVARNLCVILIITYGNITVFHFSLSIMHSYHLQAGNCVGAYLWLCVDNKCVLRAEVSLNKFVMRILTAVCSHSPIHKFLPAIPCSSYRHICVMFTLYYRPLCLFAICLFCVCLAYKCNTLETSLFLFLYIFLFLSLSV